MSESVEIPDAAVEVAREAYRASACALSANGAMRAALVAARPYLMPTAEQIEAHRMTSPGTAWRDASCSCGWTGLDYWPHQTAMIMALLNGAES